MTKPFRQFSQFIMSAAGLALAGCQDDAFNFLNEFPFVPGPVCAGDPDFAPWTGEGRVCGIGGHLYPDRIGDIRGVWPPTPGEVASFSVDTRASTAPVSPGSAARAGISLFNSQSQILATKTFAASVSNGILTISSPSMVASWLANYPQAAKIGFDVTIDKINENAGQTNSFVMTLRYLGANLNSAGTIWSAPCYYDPDSGITSPNQCVFGGS